MSKLQDCGSSIVNIGDVAVLHHINGLAQDWRSLALSHWNDVDSNGRSIVVTLTGSGRRQPRIWSGRGGTLLGDEQCRCALTDAILANQFA